MGISCRKDKENMYFNARKTAAMYNDRLCSREGAAEQLGLSASTLADYELGITKVVPVDKVVLMADLYRCPELKSYYCKTECPIGRELPIATCAGGLEHSVIRFVKAFKADTVEKVKNKLLDVADADCIDDVGKAELLEAIDSLDEMAMVISETRLMCQKAVYDERNNNAIS